jgi:ATP-dependent DNA ligase
VPPSWREVDGCRELAAPAMALRCISAVCKLGLERIVSKKLKAPYRSGPSRTWIKIKNPKAPAATRAVDGTF